MKKESQLAKSVVFIKFKNKGAAKKFNALFKKMYFNYDLPVSMLDFLDAEFLETEAVD